MWDMWDKSQIMAKNINTKYALLQLKTINKKYIFK